MCISFILDVFARYLPLQLGCFKFSKVQGKRFDHSSIDVLQIYISAEEDKIKTIENIFPVMKQKHACSCVKHNKLFREMQSLFVNYNRFIFLLKKIK